MSLLTDSMESFCMMDRTSAPDGYGGLIQSWVDGAEFLAAIDLPDSSVADIADKLTERINCNVITGRAISLSVNDYVKRKRDGRLFHILQSGDDRGAPPISSIDARSHKAEIVNALPTGAV